ncbi:MAG: TIGR03576 family pyridoxal phosphate-dependent enzyme [Methanobacteriaceae archaeon]|jgi:L-seryl-tRNA(Ser) seleniumtransferase|nr:TIGR03576 family pyridoxal phosphate-dependent enzyme [Candidatus Methanorudis spinitermitis]
MLIENSLDEVKKRETSLKIIKSIINNYGRNDLYDLTGLSGGFLATANDLNLLETYVGPAIFEEKLQDLGKVHLGGKKIFPVNRTSSGILATILALVPKHSCVIHFLPELPSHPSIPRSCKLKNANYIEFDDISKFHIPKNTSLIIITGATMDHKVIDEEIFEKIIAIATDEKIPVLVDDASGARLRTAIYNQKKATELGADLVITSTDKLMMGPRGGLMAGKTDLIDEIKSHANKFGLEAQPPAIVAMVKGLEVYNKEDLLNSIEKKKKLIELLKNDFRMFEESPTGVMFSEISLKKEIANHKIDTTFSPKDLCFLWAMILLKEEHIITIPAVAMPGASATVRFDLSSNDACKLDIATLHKKIKNSFQVLLKVATNEEIATDIIFNYK